MSFLSQFLSFLLTPLKWLLALPMWVVSTPRRVMGLSLPARAALFVAVVLLGCVATVTLGIWWLEKEGPAALKLYVTSVPFFISLGLLVAIPIIVYFWLKLWLEGDISRFPDIDEAWEQGLAALEEQGLDVGGLPLFLVIGVPDEGLAKALFAASGQNLLIRDVPQGRPPLRWYADEKGVYLVCLGTGRLSKLHSLSSAVAGGGGHQDISSTLQPGGGIRGTMAAGGGGVRDTVSPITRSVAGDEPMADVGGMLRGTLVPGAPTGGGAAGPQAAPVSGSSLMSRQEADLQAERLQYVCELLRRIRQPVCALNGLLVTLPLQSIQNVMVAKDIPQAIKSDLDTIRDVSQLRAPVTALVTGMERESGFSELVRRVGSAKAKAHRFGKGFNLWNPPTEENIDAFSAHACGAFEDWVYNLFRERDALNKPGNAKLYMLLCRIRGELRTRLRSILLHGFSFSPSDKRQELPLLFNGCYFAATGDTEDRQAFVRNVFEKMIDSEEELEWMPSALAEDDRYYWLAQVGMCVDAALVIAVVSAIIYQVFW